jgi:hypothetical protein
MMVKVLQLLRAAPSNTMNETQLKQRSTGSRSYVVTLIDVH